MTTTLSSTPQTDAIVTRCLTNDEMYEAAGNTNMGRLKQHLDAAIQFLATTPAAGTGG